MNEPAQPCYETIWVGLKSQIKRQYRKLFLMLGVFHNPFDKCAYLLRNVFHFPRHGYIQG